MTSTNVLPNTTVPVVLSGQFVNLIESGLAHDFLIGGVPFRLQPSDEDPYIRDLQEDQKEQFDTSREAGEQSFGYWWMRSQSSFHGGSGQAYLDGGVAPETGRVRYADSRYIYPFEPGQLTITGALSTQNLSRQRVEQVTWAGVQKLAGMSSTDNQVHVADLPGLTGSAAYSVGTTGICVDMTSDGSNLFVACADKIWRIAPGGTVTEISTIALTGGAVTLGYAKQRLILCVGNKVYTLDPAVSVSTAPVLKYTNPNPNWTYTCVADGPNAIYLVGNAGPRSEVQSMTITDSGGAPVLGPPIEQMTLPVGEIAQSVFFYTNSQFVLCTSNGIRAGIFTPYGQPQYGPLMQAGNPTYSAAASGSLVYVGGRNAVFWVDLGTQLDQAGRFASALYADNINPAEPTDRLVDVTVFSGERDLLFGAFNSGTLLTQTSFTPDQPATLTTSWVRFDTTEPKRAFYLRVEGNFPILGGGNNPLAVTVETLSGDEVTFPIEGGQAAYEWGLSALPADQAFRLRFTLKDNAVPAGTLLRSWQIKARPVPIRYREIVLPLMCYDSEAGGGPVEGYTGFCRDRLNALESLAADNAVVTVKDKLANLSYQAIIARCQYVQRHAPTSTNGLGGKINLVLRLV